MRLTPHKMHLYTIKRFLPLLLATFLVCWFIVLMQFLWQYVDELVGKGMDLWLTLQLIFYAALYVLNLSVPLGILLGSLMTFGKLGEQLELLAMKSAGISLWRIMRPLFVVVVSIAIGLFAYLNVGMMHVSVRMFQILFSARYAQPELDIPEGVFFNGISGYSLFVTHKDRKTGHFHDLMIYDNSTGFANARIIRADSGILKMDKSKTFLTLRLFGGESFQNLKEQSLRPVSAGELDSGHPLPYIKEFFKEKMLVIPFDANFAVMEDDYLRSQFVGKNILELQHYSDSTALVVDSVGCAQALYLMGKMDNSLNRTVKPSEDPSQQFALLEEQAALAAVSVEDNYTAENFSASGPASTADTEDPDASSSLASDEDIPFPDRLADVWRAFPASRKSSLTTGNNSLPLTADSLMASCLVDKQNAAIEYAITQLSNLAEMSSGMHMAYSAVADDYIVNAQEKHRKMTFPVACIVFFLVGAPLGAIIRKGGIGMPVLASVIIFILYYVIETFGLRAVGSGEMPVWLGTWLSTLVILPLGIFLTIQAARDSATLNTEAIGQRIKSFFRPPTRREMPYKEFIMQPLDHAEAKEQISSLLQVVQGLSAHPCAARLWNHIWQVPDYAFAIRSTAHRLDKGLNELRDYPNVDVFSLLSRIPRWPYGLGKMVPRSRYVWMVLLPIVPLSVPLLLYVQSRQKRLRKLQLETKQLLQSALAQIPA